MAVAGGLDGLNDEPGRGLGLGHERDVRGRHLHDRRVRALGHEPLERRRDRLVLGAEQVPARQRLPRRRPRRVGEGPGGDGLLHRGQDPRLLHRDVLGEVGRDRRRIEPQKAQRVGLGVGQARRRREPAPELAQALTLVGRERRGEHQADHVGDAGGGAGDDRALQRTHADTADAQEIDVMVVFDLHKSLFLVLTTMGCNLPRSEPGSLFPA